MEEKTYFNEQQQFKLKWVYSVLIVLFLFQFWVVFQQEILDKPFGNNPSPSYAYLFGAFVLAGLITLLQKSELITKVTGEGIYVKLSPFQRTYKFINFDDIESLYVRQYRPIMDFGGWGIRYWFGKRAYNMYGNKGLQLVLESGSKVLIGTQKPWELEKTLKEMDNLSGKIKKAEL